MSEVGKVEGGGGVDNTNYYSCIVSEVGKVEGGGGVDNTTTILVSYRR